MESGGGCGGARLLLSNRPGSVNLHRKPLLPLKYSKYYSQFTFQKPKPFISVITTTTTRYSHRNDSNAETVWSQKFKFKFPDNKKRYRDIEEASRRKRKKRRWWSDKPPVMQEEEEGILEEFIDSLWFLEVLKPYGWAIPPILLSWLIASGPKAFLMTLALPLGQSVVTFVFSKLLGPKRKPRKRRKPFASSPHRDVDYELEEEEEEEEKERSESGEGKKGFRSWVGNDDGSVNVDSQETSSFGGWDELDDMESLRRRASRAGKSQRKPSTNKKFGKRGRKSDAPLLLRLLISVFPFLHSWTSLL